MEHKHIICCLFLYLLFTKLHIRKHSYSIMVCMIDVYYTIFPLLRPGCVFFPPQIEMHLFSRSATLFIRNTPYIKLLNLFTGPIRVQENKSSGIIYICVFVSANTTFHRRCPILNKEQILPAASSPWVRLPSPPLPESFQQTASWQPPHQQDSPAL